MGYFHQCHFQIADNIDVYLILISRRNRHRAGVRMHCRGIDDDGNVANYVETEQVNLPLAKQKQILSFIQIVWTGSHMMSFIMVRGSVPIYWSQPGIRYRPPPKVDRSK